MTKSLSEQAKSALRPLYHAGRALALYPKARRILRAYAEHYREAQAVYRRDLLLGQLPLPSIDTVRVEKISPGQDNNLINLPASYSTLVDSIRQSVQVHIDTPGNCFFFPKVTMHPTLAHIEDIPSVRNGDVIAVQLRDYRRIDGLEALCQLILPQIERNVYGSYVVVDKVYIYRNVPSRASDQVSWNWHYDNHPSQIKKLMVYLTDVSEDTGPFEYLRATKSGEGLYMNPTPLSGYGRISLRQVQRWLAAGFEAHKVTGLSGTILFFDENVVHKANRAYRTFRDVVVYQIRPATFRPPSYLDPKWTGSFQHIDINPDPWDHYPQEKENMLSG